MARRQLIVTQPSPGRSASACVRVHVDDRTPVGPWVTTLAGHMGYPLVDAFGKPITYRLRSISSEHVLLTTGRFADAHFSPGSRFVLEPDFHQTEPMPSKAPALSTPQGGANPFPRFSRRQMLHMGILGTVSLFGLGTGATTAFARHILTSKSAVSPPKEATAPIPFGISIQSIFTQHQQSVRAVAWSPDEQMVLSGGDDNLALVWQPGGSLLHSLPFNAHVHALAWSPDGLQIAVGANTTAAFFDAQTMTLLAKKTHHTAPITALAWTEEPSSTPLVVSAAMDKTAIVWDGQSYLPRVLFRRHTTAIEALALLADTAVTTSQGGVARVWNVLSGQEIHGYYFETQHTLRAVALSSTGSLAMGGDDGVVSLWSDGRACAHQAQDTFGVRCIDAPVHLQGHTRPVHAVAFSPDGTLLATGGDDKSLIIWSTFTRAPLLRATQQEALTALSWSPSGQLLAGILGKRIVIWRLHQ